MSGLERFESVEALIEHVKERADDFERVEMMLAPVHIRNTSAPDGAVTIRLCSGAGIMVDRTTGEALLNDGLLQRLRVPVELRSPRGSEGSESA